MKEEMAGRKWKMKLRKKCQKMVRKDTVKNKKGVFGKLFLGRIQDRNAVFKPFADSRK